MKRSSIIKRPNIRTNELSFGNTTAALVNHISFGVTKISHRFALIELSAQLRKPYSLSHTRFKTRENAGSHLTGVAAAERDIGLSYLSTFAASSHYLVHT